MRSAYDSRTEEEIALAESLALNNQTVGADGLTDAQRQSANASAVGAAERQRQTEIANAERTGWLDPNSPTYRGPGWTLNRQNELVLSDPFANQQYWQQRNNPVPTGPGVDVNATLDALNLNTPSAPATPAAPLSATAALSRAAGQGGVTPAPNALANAFSGAPRVATASSKPAATEYLSNLDIEEAKAPAPTDPTAQAPTVNRERIDSLLTGVDSVQQKLMNLADETRGMSAAEAALHKAGREADLRTAFGVDQSQRSALGAARGARNRGDRALLERQAVGEAGYLAQEGARTQALATVEQQGQLAQLRATEEDSDRRFKAELLGKAADLGLNTAALEVDISKADLGSATSWLNNQFDLLKQQGQLDLGYAQLDQQKAESILGFTKDMAALQFEYDKLSVEDQNATDALLMQKYGIDQSTMVALKQIKASQQVNWGQILTAVIGGVGSGATAAIAKTSDERTKAEITRVDPDEFDELMEAVNPETWRYKDDALFAGDGTSGKRLGPMTQDLKRSRLGRSMVIEQPGSFDAVDSGRAGLAALSGLALVHERLKQLEGRALMAIVDFEQDPGMPLGTGNFRDDKGRSMYLSDPETASRFIKTMPGASLGKTVSDESAAIAQGAMGAAAPVAGPDLRTANNANDTGLPVQAGDVRAPVPGVPGAAAGQGIATINQATADLEKSVNAAQSPKITPKATALVGKLDQLPKKPAPTATSSPSAGLPLAGTSDSYSRQVVKGANKANVARRITEEEAAQNALDQKRTELSEAKDARVATAFDTQMKTASGQVGEEDAEIAAQQKREAAAARLEDMKRQELKKNDETFDPDRYMKNTSSGKKLSMIVLAALNGGFGALNGQKDNGVLAVIDSEIDRDLDDQKQQIASGRIRIGNEIDKYVKQGFDALTAEKLARDRKRSAIALLSELQAKKLAVTGENAENARFLTEQSRLEQAKRRGDLLATTEDREQTSEQHEVKHAVPKAASNSKAIEEALKLGQLRQQQLEAMDAAEVSKILGYTDDKGAPRPVANARAKVVIDGAKDLAVKMPRFEVAENRIRQALEAMGVPIEAYDAKAGVIDWSKAGDLRGVGPVDSRPMLKNVVNEGPIGVVSTAIEEAGVGPQPDVDRVKDSLIGIQEDLTYATTGASATREQIETFRTQSGQDLKSQDSVKSNLSRTAQTLATQRNAMLSGDKDATKLYQHQLNRSPVTSLTPHRGP